MASSCATRAIFPSRGYGCHQTLTIIPRLQLETRNLVFAHDDTVGCELDGASIRTH